MVEKRRAQQTIHNTIKGIINRRHQHVFGDSERESFDEPIQVKVTITNQSTYWECYEDQPTLVYSLLSLFLVMHVFVQNDRIMRLKLCGAMSGFCTPIEKECIIHGEEGFEGSGELR